MFTVLFQSGLSLFTSINNGLGNWGRLQNQLISFTPTLAGMVATYTTVPAPWGTISAISQGLSLLPIASSQLVRTNEDFMEMLQSISGDTDDHELQSSSSLRHLSEQRKRGAVGPEHTISNFFDAFRSVDNTGPFVSATSDGGYVICMLGGTDGSRFRLGSGAIVQYDYKDIYQTSQILSTSGFDSYLIKSIKAALLTTGNILVTFTEDWNDGSGRVNAQFIEFNANLRALNDPGNKLPWSLTGRQINIAPPYATSIAAPPAALSNGGVLFAYHGNKYFKQGDTLGDSVGFDIYAGIHNANLELQGLVFRVNENTAGDQTNAIPIGLEDDTKFFSFEGPDGGGKGVFMRAFSDYRTPLTGDVRINSYTTGDQAFHGTAYNKNAKLLCSVWQTPFQFDGFDIVARIYFANSTMVTPEILISKDSIGDQTKPSITVLPNAFAIAFESKSPTTNDTDILLQFINLSGELLGDPITMNTYTTGDQLTPSIATLLNNEVVVAWMSKNQYTSQSGWDIYWRRASLPLTASNLKQTLVLDEDSIQVALKSVFVFSPRATVTVKFTLSNPAAGKLSTGTHGQSTSTYDANTGVWTATGPVANINALLAGIKFTPAANYQGNFSIGSLITDGASPALMETINVTVKSLNDAPTLTDTPMTVSYTEKGSAVVVDNSIVVADVDNPTLTSGVVAITNVHASEDVLSLPLTGCVNGAYDNGSGKLTLSGSCSASQYQAALRSVTYKSTAKQVNTEPRKITLTVNDGTDDSNIINRTVNVIAVNDPPVITTNQFRINKGQQLTMISDNLLATDEDNATSALVFTVSSLQNARFVRGNNVGMDVLSFTQKEVDDGALTLIHDGSNLAPSYRVSISDGTTNTVPANAMITYSGNNVAPVLSRNTLTIKEGESVTLAATHLLATDADNLAAQLIFMASDIQAGRFETTAGRAVTSFIQQQITDRQIQFIHDGSEQAPSYQMAVSDSTASTNPAVATIAYTPVNDAPQLTSNSLKISEGHNVILSASNLSAVDPDSKTTADQLMYTVSNVQHGQFEVVSKPNTAITTFSQAQINGSQIRFVHDGSNIAPSYSVSVSDGQLGTTPVAATVDYTPVNNAPVFENNKITIRQGENILISTNDLSVKDDSVDTKITYAITNAQHCSFELTDQPGVAITSFTQAQIKNKQVRYVHDNSEIAPTFSVTVSDSEFNIGPQAATINYVNVNNSPMVIGTIPDKTAVAGEVFSFAIAPKEVFSDPDQDPLTLSAHQDDDTSLPKWLDFTNNEFKGVPPVAAVGLFKLKVTAKDPSQASTSTTFRLAINAANGGSSGSSPSSITDCDSGCLATWVGSIAGSLMVLGSITAGLYAVCQKRNERKEGATELKRMSPEFHSFKA